MDTDKKSGRKIGCATYTYNATKVAAVNSVNGKVIVNVRNDDTGQLILDEKVDLKDVEERGLPLPTLSEFNSGNKSST